MGQSNWLVAEKQIELGRHLISLIGEVNGEGSMVGLFYVHNRCRV
jgi:hypothetical protein